MSISVGQPLPRTSVTNKGEIEVNSGKVTYKDWSASELTGKVRVIQHIAGKTSAKAMNEAVIEAIKRAKFPKEQYQTTTLINLKESIWGTGAIVTGKAETGKKEYPWSSVVLDANGTVRSDWGLKKDGSAIILLNQAGEVLFFKDGSLENDEISDLITAIDSALGGTAAEQELESEAHTPA